MICFIMYINHFSLFFIWYFKIRFHNRWSVWRSEAGRKTLKKLPPKILKLNNNSRKMSVAHCKIALDFHLIPNEVLKLMHIVLSMIYKWSHVKIIQTGRNDVLTMSVQDRKKHSFNVCPNPIINTFEISVFPCNSFTNLQNVKIYN